LSSKMMPNFLTACLKVNKRQIKERNKKIYR
jgi:hypothetical protein